MAELVDPAPAAKCANCGATLIGGFCAECGQRHRDLNQPTTHLLSELLREFFGADRRLFRTVGLLFTSPGALTKEYFAGRRVRYSPPFQLYAVASAIVFVALRAITAMNDRLYGRPISTGASYYDGVAAMLILLMPALAVVLKAVYPVSNRPMHYHLVFSLHTGAAGLSWVLIVILLKNAVNAIRQAPDSPISSDASGWAFSIGLIGFIMYVMVGLKRAYADTWPGAVVRSVTILAVVLTGFQVLLPLIMRLHATP